MSNMQASSHRFYEFIGILGVHRAFYANRAPFDSPLTLSTISVLMRPNNCS